MIQVTPQGAAASTPIASTLLTKSELAQTLRMSVRSLEGLVKSGQLPEGKRRGRHLYWHASVASKWHNDAFADHIEWAQG